MAFANILFAYNLKQILRLEARLYPKIMRLDESLANKKTLRIGIVYSKKTYDYAAFLAKLLKNQNVKADLLSENDLKEEDAYILTVKKVKKSVLKKLLSYKKLIFTIYPGELKNAMIGIYIGVRILPMINPYLIKKEKIYLDPIIFEVSKVYYEK
jgi:hypothetical protein